VPAHPLSLGEFLEWENAQPDRYEYFRGEVFAMTGGRRTMSESQELVLPSLACAVPMAVLFEGVGEAA
jgi:hypothetical protein